MRLICPNCGAQYEVDANLIPEGGRDVQCSNCGNTWFQRANHAEDEAPQEVPVAAREPETVTIEDAPRSAPLEDEVEDLDDDLPEFPDGPTIPPRQVDPDALNVLREEAEHEQELRRAEAARAQAGARPPETPEIEEFETIDIGEEVIAAVDPKDAERAKQARERMARLRGVEPDEPEKSGSRSDLLPDIDEINSTLRAQSERQKEAASSEAIAPITAATERKRGFRLGFGTSLIIVGVLTGAYVYAPLIVRSVPATEPVLVGYVRIVNEGRGWLERGMQGALDRLGAGDDVGTDSGEAESQG